MVSEVISYRGKSALREVGKVFGLSLEQVDRLSGLVSWWDSWTRDARRERVARGRLRSRATRASSRCSRLARRASRASRGTSRSTWAASSSRRAPRRRRARRARDACRSARSSPGTRTTSTPSASSRSTCSALGMLTAIRKALDLAMPARVTSGRRATARLDSRPSTALARIPAEDPLVYDAPPARRHGRRLPDREPGADGDAAAAQAAQVLRSRRRGGHRAARAHPGRHGAPVPATPQRRGGRRRRRTRARAHPRVARWACRSSRSR